MSEVLHGFIGDPPEWAITLRSGETVRCWAHTHAEELDEYVFSLFFDGTPPARFVVFRIQTNLVETIYG